MKAFIAVILYGVIYTVAEAISAAMGVPHGITCYAILFFTAAVLFYLFYSGWFSREKVVFQQQLGQQQGQGDRQQRQADLQQGQGSRQQRQVGQKQRPDQRRQADQQRRLLGRQQSAQQRQADQQQRSAQQRQADQQLIPLFASYALLAVVPVACFVLGIVTGSYEFNFNLFVLAICAAILEELFFRGFFIEWLCEQMGFSLLISIGLSALAFAIMHLANAPAAGAGAALLQSLYALAIGIALGCAYTMCPRIVPCILLHILINAASFSGVSNIFVDIGEIALAIAVAVYLLMTMNKRTQRTAQRRAQKTTQKTVQRTAQKTTRRAASRLPRRAPQQERLRRTR